MPNNVGVWFRLKLALFSNLWIRITISLRWPPSLQLICKAIFCTTAFNRFELLKVFCRMTWEATGFSKQHSFFLTTRPCRNLLLVLDNLNRKIHQVVVQVNISIFVAIVFLGCQCRFEKMSIQWVLISKMSIRWVVRGRRREVVCKIVQIRSSTMILQWVVFFLNLVRK